ncbi:hypothetical protein [Streptomyces sp. NBC_00696]|uniref:hypothetical protein n=1 Tax=Streptomyces sp. NBC_00696 TaxID=2903672 RepID=UPI002E374E88|nr:hypothetical protein [Streptomyces sp. NBC_00696]
MSLNRKLNIALTTGLLSIGVTLGTAQLSEAAPATISCAYGHVCGVDDAGRRFDFSICGRNEPLALSGPGEFFNNQTPGTAVHWLNADGSIYGGAAAGAHGYIDWTHVWFVRAC